MKKYSICLYLFLAVSLACVATGYLVKENRQRERIQPVTETVFQTETAAENRAAANQQQVRHETSPAEEYYLVAEDGFLLVFLKDQETICLYTHVPIMDFPAEEREKLREGIWFPSMMEVFQYLESYTS